MKKFKIPSPTFFSIKISFHLLKYIFVGQLRAISEPALGSILR